MCPGQGLVHQGFMPCFFSACETTVSWSRRFLLTLSSSIEFSSICELLPCAIEVSRQKNIVIIKNLDEIAKSNYEHVSSFFCSFIFVLFWSNYF